MTKIGDYTLHKIETGRFALDGGAMFGIIPKALWARRLPPDDRNRIPLHMRCLLLEKGDQLILIDDGLGDKYDAKFADLFAVDHETADLHRSLKEAGFDADDVTDVILTHLHFDHCGGSTRRAGDGLAITFKNARYHVQRAHWHWASDPNERERASFLKENLAPLEASGQLNLLDGAGVLFPGIELLLVNGHTEAQQMVKIADEETTLVFAADLLPTSHHLRPPWIMAYDVRPLVTLEEKAAFLDRVWENGWQLFFEHDPEVAVASLERTERGLDVTAQRTLEEL